jgi:hypothetical protein
MSTLNSQIKGRGARARRRTRRDAEQGAGGQVRKIQLTREGA